ncbi:MAG TPA: hypothetical protein PKE64_21425 [Anaerolineae bacterium]|nr:hypothetical protein [Anaerolineae bacterium]
MATEESKRINVTLPADLLDELREEIPRRERNQFIVDVLEKELRKLRLKRVLDQLRQKAAWSDEDHPNLTTVEEVNVYVRELRESSLPRNWDEIVGEVQDVG